MTRAGLEAVILRALEESPSGSSKEALTAAIIKNIEFLIKLEKAIVSESEPQTTQKVLKAPPPQDALLVGEVRRAQEAAPKLVTMEKVQAKGLAKVMSPEEQTERAAEVQSELIAIQKNLEASIPETLRITPNGSEREIILKRSIVTLGEQEAVRVLFSPEDSPEMISVGSSPTANIRTGETGKKEFMYSQAISKAVFVDDNINSSEIVSEISATAKEFYAPRGPIQTRSPSAADFRVTGFTDEDMKAGLGGDERSAGR